MQQLFSFATYIYESEFWFESSYSITAAFWFVKANELLFNGIMLKLNSNLKLMVPSKTSALAYFNSIVVLFLSSANANK